MVEVQHNPIIYNQQADTVTIFVKREPQRADKNGRITGGELPNEYFTDTPSYFNKDATLANKDKTDLKYDFDHMLIQGRLLRERTPEEEYTVDDLISELDREYAAVNLDTMNKAGVNRKLFVTTLTESSTQSILKEEKPKDKGGWFKRK